LLANAGKQYGRSPVIVSWMIDQSYRLPCDRYAALNYVRRVGLSKTILQPCAGVKPQSLATVFGLFHLALEPYDITVSMGIRMLLILWFGVVLGIASSPL
jgi:hypothetical protein